MWTTRIAISVLMAGLLSAASAQSSDTEADTDTVDSAAAMEEVVVMSDKPLVLLRLEMRLAEREMYKMFNELNTNDEFDVVCRDEAYGRSSLTGNICRPNFESDISDHHRRTWMRPGPSPAALNMMRIKNKQLKEEMIRVMRTHPEFLQALLKLAGAIDTVEHERKRRCEGRILICRRK